MLTVFTKLNTHDHGQKGDREDGLVHNKHGDLLIPNTYIKGHINIMLITPTLGSKKQKFQGFVSQEVYSNL